MYVYRSVPVTDRMSSICCNRTIIFYNWWNKDLFVTRNKITLTFVYNTDIYINRCQVTIVQSLQSKPNKKENPFKLTHWQKVWTFLQTPRADRVPSMDRAATMGFSHFANLRLICLPSSILLPVTQKSISVHHGEGCPDCWNASGGQKRKQAVTITEDAQVCPQYTHHGGRSTLQRTCPSDFQVI